MRIRRRPQSQALIPAPPPQQASDPSTAAPFQPLPPNAPAGNQHHWPARDEENNHKSEELHSYSIVDLGCEPSPAARRVPPPQQGDDVVGRRSDSPSGHGGGGGAQREEAAATADGHTGGSLEHGRRDECDWPVINAARERLVNEVIVPEMPLQMNEEIKSDGLKRRGGTTVFLEGSRCSRMNGRGWRCSQAAPVGYSLCDHHIIKSRQSRSANNSSGGGGRVAGAPKQGRTEPDSRKSASPLALAIFAAAASDNIEPADVYLASEFS